MDERNYGLQSEERLGRAERAAELDARWIRIVASGVAWGVGRALFWAVVVVVVAYLFVWGAIHAVSGPAVCDEAWESSAGKPCPYVLGNGR